MNMDTPPALRFEKIQHAFQTEKALEHETKKESLEKSRSAVENNISTGNKALRDTLVILNTLGGTIDVAAFKEAAENAHQEHLAAQEEIAEELSVYKHLVILEVLNPSFSPPDRDYATLPDASKKRLHSFINTVDESWTENPTILRGALLTLLTGKEPIPAELLNFIKKHYHTYLASEEKGTALFSTSRTKKIDTSFFNKHMGSNASKPPAKQPGFFRRLTSSFKRPPSQPSV